MTIACIYCLVEAPPPEKGAYVRAPNGWGVVTTCFKVQGSRRQHRIGDSVHYIGSQGMGSRIATDYLCPRCLADADCRAKLGIPEESLPSPPTPYIPGRRKLQIP